MSSETVFAYFLYLKGKLREELNFCKGKACVVFSVAYANTGVPLTSLLMTLFLVERRLLSPPPDTEKASFRA